MKYKSEIKKISKRLDKIYPNKTWQEFYEEISSLEDDFRLVNINCITNKISVVTDKINIEYKNYNYYLGTYKISINLNTIFRLWDQYFDKVNNVLFDRLSLKDSISYHISIHLSLINIRRTTKCVKNIYLHPHASKSQLCVGNNKDIIANNFLSGDIQSIFLIMKIILHNYNDASQITKIDNCAIEKTKIDDYVITI